MGREKNHLQVSEDKMEEISDISPGDFTTLPAKPPHHPTIRATSGQQQAWERGE